MPAAIDILGGHLAGLADPDALSLASDLHILVHLTTDNDIVFDKLDSIVLAIIAFRGGMAEQFRIQDPILDH